MKNLSKIMLWMAVLPLLFVMSCKDDDPQPADEGKFGELSEYMQTNNLDIDDVISGWITTAPATVAEVADWAAGYHIFDIRGADDFAKGHIVGAVNSSLGSIVADAAGVTKPILVVCYSGQSAGHATVALRLSGHPDAKVLKWGMSGWTSAEGYDKWSSKTNNFAASDPNWTLPADPATSPGFDYPTITSTATGAALLAERVSAMTSGGFKSVAGTDVVATPTNYFINNYWKAEDNATYGHIATAIRNNTFTLENGGLKDLDPSKQVVSYCWTGQTSSMLTAYLIVLGYDAVSLRNGVNSMIYDELTGHKWSPPTVDLPVVVD